MVYAGLCDHPPTTCSSKRKVCPQLYGGVRKGQHGEAGSPPLPVDRSPTDSAPVVGAKSRGPKQCARLALGAELVVSEDCILPPAPPPHTHMHAAPRSAHSSTYLTCLLSARVHM